MTGAGSWYGSGTKAAGRKRTYSYGQKTVTETTPAGLRVTYTYNGRKDLVSVLEEDLVTGEKRERTAVYDRRHLPVRVRDGAGNE
jgi:hypothetical protein